jgi:hypothetical protein
MRLEAGMVVKHFKRETVTDKNSSQYLYLILGFAEHTETKEKLVIYQALYDEERIYARPYDMFMSKVDKEKYPDIKQEYRFEETSPEDYKEYV